MDDNLQNSNISKPLQPASIQIREVPSKKKPLFAVVIVVLLVINMGLFAFMKFSSSSSVPTESATQKSSPSRESSEGSELSSTEAVEYKLVDWDIAGLSGQVQAPKKLVNPDVAKYIAPLGIEATTGYSNDGCILSYQEPPESCYWTAELFDAIPEGDNFRMLSIHAGGDAKAKGDYCTVALEDSHPVKVLPSTTRYVTVCGRMIDGRKFVDVAIFSKYKFNEGQSISNAEFKSMVGNALMYVGLDYVGAHQAASDIAVDYELFSKSAAGQEMIKILRSVVYDK